MDVVVDAASSLGPKAFRRCEPPIMAGLSALSTTCLRNLKLFVKLLLQVQVKTRCLQKKENPAAQAAGFSGVNPGDDLLSHGLSHTTIGAAAFHFRVRDGIGWFHSANFTREAFGESHSSLGDKAPASHSSCDVACTWMLLRRCRKAKAT